MASGVETLTVLFTDLVGSTDQRVRVGEVAADALRARHDRLTEAAICRYGGTVVKHTGDGVMATFTGASEALAAAVAVQQSIDADNRFRDGNGDTERLSVRIGISAGDVTVEDGDCFGLPVVEAQRLESFAEPGQILTASIVRALARGRGNVELRTVGALVLKGLDAEIEADEVLWTPLAAAVAAVPPVLADRGELVFAGRTKERELLLGAWRTAAAGGTRVVLVAGEPGIGKTRLVTEFAHTVLAGGGAVLAGRCDEHVGVPYQPFAEALRFWLDAPGAGESLGSNGGELARLETLVARLRPDLPTPLKATPEAERLALFDAVRAWLASVATSRSLLFVVDDAHWAEMDALLLLRHVVVTDPVPGLLVALTYRDTDLDRSHPLGGVVAELRRRSDVTRLQLEGLGTTEVSSLLARPDDELGTDSARLAHALRDETGGNPFFIGEVLRHLSETGALVHDDGRWIERSDDTPVLPEGIRDVVGRRLSLLPDTTQTVLRDAAVVGGRFALEVLATVAQVPEDAVVDALEPALHAHLLVEVDVGRYQFAHALVRSTLHAELSTTRRARLHRAVAVALEQLHCDDTDAIVAELAYHWSEAGPGAAHSEALVYAQRAAELAFARPAPDEAARWCRHALELLDGADPVVEARLRYRLGAAEAMSSTPGWQETLLRAAQAAEAVGDVALMARALMINQHLVFTERAADASPEKVALLERALELVGEDRGRRAKLLAALAGELALTSGSTPRVLALFREVLDLAEALDDPLERSHLRQLTAGIWDPECQDRVYLEDRARQELDVLSVAGVRGLHEVAGNVWGYHFYTSLSLGRPNRHDVIAEIERLCTIHPNPLAGDHLLLVRVTSGLIDGDLAAARMWTAELDRQFAAHGRAADAALYGGGARVQTLRESHDLSSMVELAPLLPGFADEGARPGPLGAVLACAHADAGQHDELCALIRERSANDFADIPPDRSWPTAAALWAEAVSRSRIVRACEAMYEHLAPAHDLHQVTGGWYLGATSRYLAMLAAALGRHDEAEEHFAHAELEHIGVESPPWLARTRLDWAEHRLAVGDTTGAHRLAQSAVDAIGELGLDASAKRASRILGS